MRQEQIDAIAKIAEQNGGNITPQQLIDAAKPIDSVLHELIEWDDKEAAAKYRIQQARAIIRSVEVQIKDEGRVFTAPRYIRDPELAPNEAGYSDIFKVKNKEESKRDALVSEFGRAGAALSRARAIARVFEMHDDVDAAIDTVDALKAVAEELAIN